VNVFADWFGCEYQQEIDRRYDLAVFCQPSFHHSAISDFWLPTSAGRHADKSASVATRPSLSSVILTPS
jgi:hypothetical protein